MELTAKVNAGGKEYTLGALTLDQAERIFKEGGDPKVQAREMVKQSLLNGGNGDASDLDVGTMPFVIFVALRNAGLELNGLAQPEGEATAEATA